jgi:hypothetical protein
VQYLVDDDAWGARSGNLYVLTGHFRQMGGADGASSVLGSLDEAREAISGWMASFRDTGLPEPVSIAMAALLVLGVVSWAALSGGQRLSRVSPAYARATPLAAQGGYAGRFAVLALPSTDRGLLLLELKRSLEEDLRQRLELPPATSGRDLIEPVRQSGLLGEASLTALDQVFRQLAASEVAVMSARRLSIPDRALSRLQAQIERIFDELSGSKGTRT